MALRLASASSSASAHSNYSYDVFLNHRGTDVKKTFASHLYRRLLSYGFRVFLDQPEMQRGEKINPQIERAIETASVHVAIFSPGYAESRWCLDELVLMLKSGATIIPVFYKVESSDLRWTTENGKYTDRLCAQALRLCCWPSSDRVYTKALLNHEKKGRYGQEILAAWKKALAEVSYLSGFELESCNGDEGELVDEVARQVQKKVTKAPLHVAKHPTGLDEKLQDFEKTVSLEEQLHRGGTILLGIIGLGGVGKTTLAKEFFNRNRSHYQRSCFLAEVRDAAARNTLTSLQGQLCKDLTGVTPVMCSIHEGKGQLSHLRYSQSLVILDDVDHDDQLDALFFPVKDFLPSGSLILVTSRDKDVLRQSTGIGELSIYNMTGMSREYSRDLFCLYAFNQPHPAERYEDLVIRVLDACRGLPLSLKVIGALLHLKSPEFWEAQLRKLSQVLPTEIQSRLQISYDSLDKQEKEIFLDTACFFIGINRDTAIKIWDGSGWEGSLALGTLESKCLVTVDEENCIRMHDHLRDLGRDLADKEPPGCPRRLWRPTDNLFRNVPTQSTVRGISMVQERFGESFQSTAEFSNRIVDIRGLQLLRAPCDRLESLFKVVIHPDLLWLRCEIDSFSSLPSWIQINNSDSSLPSWIPIKNLRVLELVSQSYRSLILGTLWNTEIEAPHQLRELNISFELFHLPKSIEQLTYLEKIELPNFKGTLPEEFFHLPSLKHLRLGAGMKSLPDSLGNFTNLQHIDLSGCEDLQTLLPSFGNLTKLQLVKLEGCKKLKMLPESFMNLIRLKHLDLSDCCDLTLSDQTLGNISTLERLNFYRCHKIEVLASQVTQQQSLEELILDYTQLKELPSAIGDLRQLTSLSIMCCPIREVPFASVEKVQGGMLRLYSLNLSNTRITEISFGEGVCPVLESLDLQGCDDLVEVGALPTTLTALQLTGCCALKKITELRGLAKLRSLDMNGCKEIEELPGLGVWELNNLEKLYLRECPISVLPFASVEKVQGGRRFLDSSIDKCMLRLKFLSLSKTRITEISFGEGVFPVLQSLDLAGCDDLVEVGALPTTLTSLDLMGCCALKKITGLRGLAKLRSLDMRGCKEIEELPGLGVWELDNLEDLNLQECPISVLPFASVEKVQGGRRFLDSSIDKCMLRLESLNLSKTRITEISFGEGVCPVLESLYLAGCDDLVEVGALPTTLTSLDLSFCSALRKITGLSGLAKLQYLYMVGCDTVEELPGLETLISMEGWLIPECENMKRIRQLAGDQIRKAMF